MSDTGNKRVLLIARMQHFGTRILAEDINGRFYIVEKDDKGPVREVIYFDYYMTNTKH